MKMRNGEGNDMRRRIAGAALAAAALLAAGCGGSSGNAASPPSSAPAVQCGPGLAPSASGCTPTATPPAPFTCVEILGDLAPMAHDMRRQDKLSRAMSSGPPPHIALSTKDDILAGAWIDPGAWSGDLDQFLSDFGSVTATRSSEPYTLSAAAQNLAGTASNMQADASGETGAISVQDYEAFHASVVSLAGDCGLSA